MNWGLKDLLVVLVAVGAPIWAVFALARGSITVPGRHRGNPRIKRYRRDSDPFMYWLNIFLLLGVIDLLCCKQNIGIV